MKNYIVHNEWCIIEDGFHPEYNEITESLMSLGNGRMGGRGNFEEKYSGKTLQGSYVAGVWFPDKTRVGWWKNGYPNYFAKVLNACNWIGIDLEIEGELLDLSKCDVYDFRRVLNMFEGTLERSFVATLPSGKSIKINTLRFCSLKDDESGAIRFSITPLNFSSYAKLTVSLDGDVSNKDSNHGEKFWNEINKETGYSECYLTLETKKSIWESVPTFQVCTGMKFECYQHNELLSCQTFPIKKDKYVANEVKTLLKQNEETIIYKYAVNLSSENYSNENLLPEAKKYLDRIVAKGFNQMLEEQKQAWKTKWEGNDIQIDGDIAAQQGIRFNIFHLQQTYTGQDARLNIGPKGFTGEKYGGSTYWDTEAYCLPFYLSTSEQKVARNLLVYRHNHLQRAIENAVKLGFSGGAALYPMVTMNGEECHNEWEITFEEIHRNGAIAYAIFDYIRYTGDENYLNEYGLEVLIGISRFWAQRINWSSAQQKYVMLGVTGPNEYENNVNNNWYTNYLAVWCLKYTLEAIEKVKKDNFRFEDIIRITNFDETAETSRWKNIIKNMYFPYDTQREVFLQQDGFLDKELLTVNDIAEHRPINQKWSWDRILRSCFIKQADVLQGMYFFEDDFSIEELRRNFNFYEPMTVHESSLSPCVHVIQAAKLGKKDKAYEMYVRTARLDLDDYNNDTEDGLHITSMAGTWMSVVKGFGGLRVKADMLSFSPFLPEQWQSFSFRVGFRNNALKVAIQREHIAIENLSDSPISVLVEGNKVSIRGLDTVNIPH
ncbi:family 65 glycosyl hydrolase domain-containing protein [Emticicia sp. BO119]|uniref:family 65 glycosyl hydrolase domain-containing protein n=1 Tax=Emticicia sp. BO119 TaxID=2757768 RepID=UPI0015F06277|nr:family 65 glycosyl hydrolase domain-containing protein [Emticicia sp. BO119]MBA4853537.1 glycoside hydrolase family 65 protein [Emticicia sp. BO119]